MKKITLSLVSVMALSSFSFAGGDIAPMVEEPIIVEDNSAFYVGVGYGYFNQNVDNFQANDFELDADSIMLQAGYQYNEYLAVEGRYWIGVGDITQTGDLSVFDQSGDYDSWGLYVKPMYPVTEDLDVYALLGYASNSVSFDNGAYWDTDGFSWGLGAQYEVMDNVLLFVDYVNMGMQDSVDLSYNNTVSNIDSDIDLYTINFGVSYKF